MVARPILASILCSAALAHASPRTDPTVGRAVFTGATVPNATSIGLNPAALGTGTFGEVFAALTGVLDQIRIDQRDLDADSGALSPGARVRATEVTPGGMLAIVVRTGIYTLGFQAQTPPAEQFVSGYEALRYHTTGGRQRDWLATIAGSIQVTKKFYVGAHIAHDNTFLRLRYTRDSALASGTGPRGIASDCGGAPCGIENPLADERYDVDVRSPYVSGGNLKVTVGLVAEVYRDVWLGVAYHTPPGFAIQTELEGKVDVTRAPRDGGGEVRGGSSVDVQYPASVDAEIRARLPRLLDLHVGGRWEDLSRLRAYDVRAYNSTFADNGIPEWTLRPRALHDSFALWAGLEQADIGQPLLVGARVGFETSSVDAHALSPMTVAPASFTLDAGAQLRIARSSWLVQLSYGLAYFPTVSVTKSDFDPRFQLECIESGYDYTSRGCAASREGFAIPTAAGDYGRLQHALRLGLRYELP
ncbi:MAG TPA: hypothetical protein VN253_25335 [Kofleriaceae bacterium]|nr:hypothetical protein [Kofleriaceae bacterium]